VIMESGYVLMASILPIREHVDNLTISVFLNKLVVNPLGPYWYLHTLMICGVLYFAVFCWKNISIFSRLIILGLSYYFISLLEVTSLACTMYFMVGIVIRQSGFPFLDVFRKSWWAFVVLIVLFLHPETFDKATFGGALIVYFVFSASLLVYPHIPGKAKDVFLFLGRNSLPLYIFSPIFTICCKVFIPFLSFDSTRLLFLVISLPICVLGCLVTCKVLDLLRISPLMFGRKHVMV
jgi:putative acyltransferase